MRRFFALGVMVWALGGFSCTPPEEPARKIEPKPNVKKEKESLDTPVPKGLQERVQAAIDHVHHRHLLVSHSFWTIFHGILGMGLEASLYDPETQKSIKAIDYVCEGGPIRGLEFIPIKDGGVDVRTTPGTGEGQGHQDQFIAEMVQQGLSPEKVFLIGGNQYRFKDFLHHSKMRASLKRNQELSWTIIIVAQFFGTDHKWKNADGDDISLEDMMQYELKEPMDIAACGGTHRLFGLTWVYFKHLHGGGKKIGVWKDTADFLEKYKTLARNHQSAHGIFSLNYFAPPEKNKNPKPGPDRLALQIATTGHILEWLAFYLPDKELKEPWMQEAANALAMMVLENRSALFESGGLYHAVHGLHIYRDRVFGRPGSTPPPYPLPPLE